MPHDPTSLLFSHSLARDWCCARLDVERAATERIASRPNAVDTLPVRYRSAVIFAPIGAGASAFRPGHVLCQRQ